MFFSYFADARKVIYTRNVIESLNSVSQNTTNKRELFPTDEAVKNIVWSAIQLRHRNGQCI
ncbi:transposase (plasmid) [Klebsiella sp. BDA134-6]|nr:transposase [Klebsiella sp. BDA134-6]QPF30599.1 transposase [Klebsiella sp. BDA134-6]